MAWMLTSTALVLFMSVPALALFYGGLVREKNMLSVLMQVFVGFSLITVLWCVYGYTLAFTQGSGWTSPFIGGFSRLFLNGTFDPATGAYSTAATFDKGTPLVELVYVGLPGDLRGHYLLPDPRFAGGTREVLSSADLHGHLVHVRLPAGRAHGLVLAGT